MIPASMPGAPRPAHPLVSWQRCPQARPNCWLGCSQGTHPGSKGAARGLGAPRQGPCMVQWPCPPPPHPGGRGRTGAQGANRFHPPALSAAHCHPGPSADLSHSVQAGPCSRLRCQMSTPSPPPARLGSCRTGCPACCCCCSARHAARPRQGAAAQRVRRECQ